MDETELAEVRTYIPRLGGRKFSQDKWRDAVLAT